MVCGMKTGVVVLCAQGIMDPLVSTLMLDYALRLQEEGAGHRMLLVTEEPGRTEISASLRVRLDAAGITWYPLTYELNKPQILQRSWNMLLVMLQSLWFVRGCRRKVVVGFLSMASSYASVLRSIGFDHFVLVYFEPHSSYMVEMGVWQDDSAKARIAKYFERRQLRNADVVIIPAGSAMAPIQRAGSKARIFKLGVTIDVAANVRRPMERDRMREEMGLIGKTVLIYVGKFQGIYHSVSEYVDFMVASCAMDPRIHHLVITFPEHATVLEQLADAAGLTGRFTLHRPVPPEKLPSILSAADLGVVAVPPKPSQRFRSPVKTALYWAAGLPVVIAEGVSDDWKIVKERKIGIVVKDLDDLDADAFQKGLSELTGPDVEQARQRCIDAAFELRDTGLMVALLKQGISGEWIDQ